jgi:ABC-type transporter Mla subunit MlaD
MDFRQPDALLSAIDNAALPARSLVMQAIKDAQSVKNRNGKVEIIFDSLRTIYQHHSTWGRYIASILIILGLLGTIVGWSQAVVNLRGVLVGMSGQVSRDVFQGMIKEILGSLSFMESAFSTTSCGFVFFLFLSFFDHVYQRAHSYFAKAFESFLANILIPFFTPQRTEESLAEISHTLKASSSGLVEVSGSISDLITSVSNSQEIYGRLAENLYGTVDGVQQSYQELSNQNKRLADNLEGLKEITSGLKAQIQQHQDITVQLFNKLGIDKSEIAELYTSLNAIIAHLEESFKNGLVETSGNIKVAVDLQSRQLERLEARQDTVLNNTNESLKQIIDSAGRILDTQKDTFKDDIDKLSTAQLQSISALDKTQQRFITLIESSFVSLHKEMAAYVANLEAHFAKSADRLTSRIDERIKDIFPSVGGLVSDMISQQQTLFNASSKYVDQLHSTVETISRMQNEHHNDELSEISKDLKKLIQTTEEKHGQFVEKLGSSFDKIAAWQQETDKAMNKEGAVNMIYFGTMNLFKSILSKMEKENSQGRK